MKSRRSLSPKEVEAYGKIWLCIRLARNIEGPELKRVAVNADVTLMDLLDDKSYAKVAMAGSRLFKEM